MRVVKLILLCHAATTAMRIGGFPAVDDPLDKGLLHKLTSARVAPSAAVCSPARAARETAEALALSAPAVPALRDIDHGSWSGRSFEDVHAESPEPFARWLDRPWAGTPDGETFAAACARIGVWMATIAEEPSALIAVVSPMIVRAAVSVAIDLPAPTSMRIDVAPLTTATLSRHRGWHLQQLGVPVRN